MFGDDVLGKVRSLLRGSPGAQRLTNRNHVVVDGLRQAHHGQWVVVGGEESSQISSCGVGVIAPNGVKNIYTICDEAVGGYPEWVGSFCDQTALDEVLDVGELDTRVSNRRTAEQVKQMCLLPDGLADSEVVTLKKPLVTMLVCNDLHFGSHLGIPLDETTDGRGQAWRKTAGRENGYLLDHEHSFQNRFRDLA